ncbi:MAG: phosphate acyltransferase PlsX [Chitinophagaceae bacterium]|nr:phosphate acyltransferase PlsX [Chitinophagaceae bacterium]
MRIGIDIMGGDYAPDESIKGVKLYLENTSAPAELYLFGDEQTAISLLERYEAPSGNVRIIHTTQCIDMHESPTRALKEKPDSSISRGFQMLSGDEIDAFISAGNTGAMLVGTLFSIKAIEGVIRPAISTLVPKINGSTGLLLDVGLNADCKPEQLNQFAIMGTVYAQLILGIDNPLTALINVGEEEGKGNLLCQAAYPLLKSNRHIRFYGNVEGRHILTHEADVLVCEGFTGNVILKLAESFYDISRRRNIHDEYFDRFNFENYGGTPVLGVTKPIIIGHGISRAKAFMNMILLAQQMIEKRVMEKMKEELS